jgi:hypothetical protein
MTPNDDEELVKIATGELVEIEMYQRALKEAGIRSKVVGQDLDASFGSALLGSMELWVWESDAEKAAAAIRYLEEHKGQPERPEPPQFGPPESDRRQDHDASRGRQSAPNYQREPYGKNG